MRKFLLKVLRSSVIIMYRNLKENIREKKVDFIKFG
jgi:hypothetical protein